MRIRSGIFPIVLALAGLAVPALADGVAVGTSSNGTVIVNGKPCRVVTTKDGSNSMTVTTGVTTGAGGLSGSTTVSPGGSGSSVTISPGSNSSSAAASSSSSSGGSSSAAAGSDCVIYRPEKK
jgi:hypothetical protein